MARKLQIKNKIAQSSNIKIALFKKEIRKTEPHKHQNYFEIIYLSAGSGFHTIDSTRYRVKPPMVFVIRKEQVHHWDLEGEPTGYVLILKKAFVDESLDKSLKTLLAEISSRPCILPGETGTIEQIFRLMVSEYKPGETNHNPVMEGMLKALLAKLTGLPGPRPFPSNRKTGLFQAYIEMISQDRMIRNSVAFFAHELHTSPQNLNIICRKASCRSAAGILSEYVIGEARRLLLYTSLTVGEVAAKLHFKDNSHFTKYFKRHTGQTPLAFRISD